MGSKSLLAGLATACVACCAIPLLGGVSIGAGLSGIGFGFGWDAALFLAVGVIAAGALLLHRRRRSRASGCACQPRPARKDDSEHEPTPPIACSLTGDEFAGRTTSIRRLAAEHLLSASRTPRSLRLTYAAAAAGPVKDLVEKERSCCAFLTFDVRESDTGVDLVVTAPEAASEAVDLLFDNFAPDCRPAASGLARNVGGIGS